jgi:hypothetical protein
MSKDKMRRQRGMVRGREYAGEEVDRSADIVWCKSSGLHQISLEG